jgi:transcriptional regulator with XRE-family HTH domain
MTEPTIPTFEELGRAIRRVRRLKGLSVDAVAGKVGLTPGHFDAVEQGCGNLWVDTLFGIAAALGVTFVELARAIESEASLQRERTPAPEEFDEHLGAPPQKRGGPTLTF